MRSTLHGCHRIDVQRRYWVGEVNGVTTVKSRRTLSGSIADLHPVAAPRTCAAGLQLQVLRRQDFAVTQRHGAAVARRRRAEWLARWVWLQLAALLLVAPACSRHSSSQRRQPTEDQQTKSGTTKDTGDSGAAIAKGAPSPSGRYYAELVPVDAQAPADRRMLRVRIVPTTLGQPTFESVTTFVAWFRLRIQWDADD